RGDVIATNVRVVTGAANEVFEADLHEPVTNVVQLVAVGVVEEARANSVEGLRADARIDQGVADVRDVQQVFHARTWDLTVLLFKAENLCLGDNATRARLRVNPDRRV